MHFRGFTRAQDLSLRVLEDQKTLHFSDLVWFES